MHKLTCRGGRRDYGPGKRYTPPRPRAPAPGSGGSRSEVVQPSNIPLREPEITSWPDDPLDITIVSRQRGYIRADVAERRTPQAGCCLDQDRLREEEHRSQHLTGMGVQRYQLSVGGGGPNPIDAMQVGPDEVGARMNAVVKPAQ